MRIKRMPTNYEKKALRYNKKIEIIQRICHVVGGIGIAVGFLWILGIAGSMDVDCISFTQGITGLANGVAVFGVSALLVNM